MKTPQKGLPYVNIDVSVYIGLVVLRRHVSLATILDYSSVLLSMTDVYCMERQSVIQCIVRHLFSFLPSLKIPEVLIILVCQRVLFSLANPDGKSEEMFDSGLSNS